MTGSGKPREIFVSEPIVVDVDAIPVSSLSGGAPSCPMRFVWRGTTYHVAKVIESSKVLRAHDGSETYVKAHAFRVLTEEGFEMVIRCDRRVRGKPWRLYTLRR